MTWNRGYRAVAVRRGAVPVGARSAERVPLCHSLSQLSRFLHGHLWGRGCRPGPRLRAGTVLTVAVLGVLLASCTTPPPAVQEPVRFGTLPSTQESIPIRVPAGAVIRASNWPSACTILTDDEIRALLPQADLIRRQPQAVVVTDISLDIGSPFNSGGPRQETAPEGACTYSFALVGAAILDLRSNIDIVITGLADPALLEPAYEDHLARDRENDDVAPVTDHAASLGPDACYSKLESSGIQFYLVCRQGSLLYEISGLSYGMHPDLPNTIEVRRDQWRVNVLVPVAARVAEKVPSS